MTRESIFFNQFLVVLILSSSHHLLADLALDGFGVSSTSGGRLDLPSQSCDGVKVNEKDLFDNIITKVYPWQRPVANSRNPVDVQVSMFLSGINDILEKEGIVRLSGFLSLQWFNELQIWNETFPYSCLDSIHLPEDIVWIPELALLNSKNKYELMKSEDVEKVRLFSNGTVSYRPGGTFEAYCKFDLYYLPFDEQECYLEFESWRYVYQYQALSLGKPAFKKNVKWLEHEQWMFIGAKVNKTREQYLSEATYDHLTFALVIRRKTGYYWMNVIVPSMIVAYAQMSVFSLPVGEVLKMHISFTCLLAYGVFQLMIIGDVPRTSDNMPLLSVYIALSMSYICLAILFEGLVFHLLNKAEDERGHCPHVPKWLCLMVRTASVPLRVKIPQALLDALNRPIDCGYIYFSDDKTQLDSTRTDQTSLDDDVEVIPIEASRPPSAISYSGVTSKRWNRISVEPYPGDGPGQNNISNNAITRREGTTVRPNATSNRQNNNFGMLPDEKEVQDAKKRRIQLIRRFKWMFAADVIERFTSVCYFSFSIATPIVMFGIIPATIRYRSDYMYR